MILPLEEVVNIAKSIAESGDIITLSPACASFDMFKNFEVRGDKFKEAMEKSATYFVLNDGKVEINEEFLVPKVQNYNYDTFGGITYEIDLSRDFYDRVVSIKKDGKEIELDKYYTVVMNNYRATNTSIYPSYEGAEVVKEITKEMSELIIDYFEKHHTVKAIEESNYIIK